MQKLAWIALLLSIFTDKETVDADVTPLPVLETPATRQASSPVRLQFGEHD
jgi:hypothetical protein